MSHTCPWWFGYFLLNPLRRLGQRPTRVLAPFVRPGMLVVEPPLLVSRAAFERSLAAAVGAGLGVTRRPRLGPNKVAVLEKHAGPAPEARQAPPH